MEKIKLFQPFEKEFEASYLYPLFIITFLVFMLTKLMLANF